MAQPRLLLVDDSETVRTSLALVLKHSGFNVATASSVNEALQLIGSQTFDALISDLHMPRPGDGLTVVSAMRHANPKAVTLIFSAYPEMQQATAAILLQADDVLHKPMAAPALVKIIRERLAAGAPPEPHPIEDLANILERETPSTIVDWLSRVEALPQVITVHLNSEVRCRYLVRLFSDLVHRLRNPLPLGSRALLSPAAARHGMERRMQGYTAAMMVEESRMLQVSIFQTLENNLHKINFSLLLVGVMAIADEVDSQLAQQMVGYVAESGIDDLPVVA